MTDPVLLLASMLSSAGERTFPTLTPAQRKCIAALGQSRAIRAGAVLGEAGPRIVPFVVVTAGRFASEGSERRDRAES